MCNDYNNWNMWYEKILDDFNFSRCDDEYVASFLNDKISELPYFSIEDVDVKDKSIVFGAGPSIKKHITYIKDNFSLNNYNLIAADGTTEALMEEGIIPDIIVTDLDGKIDKIKQANKKGSILYVHAHGDNLDKIKMYVDELENIIPTTQAKKHGYLKNYGGFTDGDRALHIAVYGLKSTEVIMAGMDFGNVVTRYSRPNIKGDTGFADDFKRLKLEYAEILTNSLIENNSNVNFVNLVDIV